MEGTLGAIPPQSGGPDPRRPGERRGGSGGAGGGGAGGPSIGIFKAGASSALVSGSTVAFGRPGTGVFNGAGGGPDGFVGIGEAIYPK